MSKSITTVSKMKCRFCGLESLTLVKEYSSLAGGDYGFKSNKYHRVVPMYKLQSYI